MTESSTLDRLLRGSEDTRLRASWRILAAAAVFFAVFLPVSVVVNALPIPDLVRNAPVIVPAAAGTVAVVFASRRLEGRSVAAQGFALDRRWWHDFVGGVGLGLAAQGVANALWIGVGAATVVETFSTGIVSGPAAVIAVLGAAVGFLGVGLWEEAVFRGVLVRNAVDGLVARDLSRRAAVLGVVAGGVVVFGLPHFLVPYEGASTVFAALQAVSAVVYFTTAYVLTESLALPVGLHFSTNFALDALLPPAGSSVPALARIDRTLTAEPSVVAVVLFSTALLTLGVVAWVRLTRGTVSVRECFETERVGAGPSARGEQDD
jgi:membrane protease YdiL (CAAX protease family)